MFTGIVEELGRVRDLEGPRLTVACTTVSQDSPVGASVAVNGVCLTVIGGDGEWLGFDVSEETFARTALGRLRPGHPVNLERPVTLLSRLGGHLVQGHVDGVGTVAAVTPQEGGATIAVRAPEELDRYLVEKGSVAVDGVSLTVASLDGSEFTFALVPHTLAVTTLGTARAGDPVNLEVDVIAKYVERLIRPHAREELA
ncbi:MAG TPA: riboflavin synthase [Actinomycetota bacterium]